MLTLKRVSVWFWDQGRRCFPKLFFVDGRQNEVVYAYAKLLIRKWYGRRSENKRSFFEPAG